MNCFLQIFFLQTHSFPIKLYNASLVSQNCRLLALFCICHYLSSMRECKLIYSSWLKNTRKNLKRMWFSWVPHFYGGSKKCQMIILPAFLLLFIHISFTRAEVQEHNISLSSSRTPIGLFGPPLHTRKPTLTHCILTIIVTWCTLKSLHCEAYSIENSIMGHVDCVGTLR